MATVSDIRMELGDTDVSFPIMSDEEIEYFLNKNNGNLHRAALDTAKSMLFKLSIRSEDSSVDIFSIRGSRAAAAYMEALKMYIKNPDFNLALSSASIFAGGVSKSDMQANLDNSDNNAITTPGMEPISIVDNNPFTL